MNRIYQPKKKCLFCKGSLVKEEYAPLEIVRCINCGLYYRDVVDFSDGYYTDSCRYCCNFSDRNKMEARRRDARLRFDTIGKVIKVGRGKFLDIGANDGLCMWEASRRGFEVFGCEPNKFALEEAKKYNLKILASTFEEGFEELKKYAPFELITMFHVLEHMVSPLETLIKIRGLMVPDSSWLVIEVPDIKSPISRIYRWEDLRINQEHLYYFDKHSLLLLLSQAGFKPVFLRRRVWDGMHQSLLANLIRLPMLSEGYLFLRRVKKGIKRCLGPKDAPRKTLMDNSELWLSQNRKVKEFYFFSCFFGWLVSFLNRGDDLLAICKYEKTK